MSEGSDHDARAAPSLILVVEDEFLIAMELEDVLTEAGYRVLGPASDVQTALALLADSCPAAAVLDVNLARERVTPVAQALSERGIPYLVASAYLAVDLSNEPLLASAVLLNKPTSPSQLISELARLLAA